MEFLEMISKSPAEAVQITDAEILAESYPIEYYEPTAAEWETWCLLRSRLRALASGTTSTMTAAGRALCDSPDPDEMEE